MENKTGKYLKYAIGEIVLVMIGILLALQVNNWNESRKQHYEETALLRTMRTDFEIKNKQLLQEYEYNKKLHDISSQFIMSQLNHQKDTFAIEEVLYFGDYFPVSTHINSLDVALEGNTVNIIRSDSLVDMFRKLKADFVNLEIDKAYLDEFWNSNLIPYFQESGLSIHRFTLI
jgi:oligoribonuclease NrnB/cAMP/cGMP phosphodiesterase (DHH superfamily)